MEHPPEVPWEELALVVAGFVGPVEDPRDLGGSSRSRVWRVTGTSGGSPASYVVKALRGDDDGRFAREAGALEVLGEAGVAPRLVGLDEDRRTMVLEDLGEGGNLADLLLGDHAAAAARGLVDWAEAIARLHLAGDPERFERRRAELDTEPRPDGLAEAVDLAVTRYREELPALGVDDVGLDGLLDLAASLSSARVLSPTDACPDNNLRVGDRMLLIDFEGATVLNPAFDVAYLRVPWASCWCAWALPDDAVEAALARYVEVARPDDAFADDLARATLVWSILTPGWFLPRAVRPEVGDGEDPRVPSRRAMIQHRLRAAATMSGPAPLTDFAGRLVERLERDWGVVHLPLAPAFR